MRDCFVFQDGDLAEGLRLTADDINVFMAALSPEEKKNGKFLQVLDCEVRIVAAGVAPKQVHDLVWLIKPGDIFLVVPLSKEADSGWLFVHQIGGIVIFPIFIR